MVLSAALVGTAEANVKTQTVTAHGVELDIPTGWTSSVNKGAIVYKPKNATWV
jgi:hypothetical protein